MSTPPEKNVNSASLIIPNLTQKISTRTPKNCQPLPKKCHLYRKNLTPPDSTLSPEYFSTPPRKFLNSHPENFSTPPRKFLNSPPPENFSTPPPKISQLPPPKLSQTPRKFCNPPPPQKKKFLNSPPPKISQPPPPQKNFSTPPPEISQPPTKITSYGKITGNNKKVIKLRRRCEDKASTLYLI